MFCRGGRLLNKSGCGSNRLRIPRSASSVSSSSGRLRDGLNSRCSAQSGAVRDGVAPWALTFDIRERETEWTDANKVNFCPAGLSVTHCDDVHVATP